MSHAYRAESFVGSFSTSKRHCNTLQHTATHCNTAHGVASGRAALANVLSHLELFTRHIKTTTPAHNAPAQTTPAHTHTHPHPHIPAHTKPTHSRTNAIAHALAHARDYEGRWRERPAFVGVFEDDLLLACDAPVS